MLAYMMWRRSRAAVSGCRAALTSGRCTSTVVTGGGRALLLRSCTCMWMGRSVLMSARPVRIYVRLAVIPKGKRGRHSTAGAAVLSCRFAN